jgi:hypothetical protein
VLEGDGGKREATVWVGAMIAASAGESLQDLLPGLWRDVRERLWRQREIVAAPVPVAVFVCLKYVEERFLRNMGKSCGGS